MRKQKLKALLLSSLLLLSLSSVSLAVTVFDVSVCDSGCDYVSFNTVESALDVNLYNPAAKVISHSGITGTVADGNSVTGQTSAATGTVAHATSDQILIYDITGTFQNDEDICVDSPTCSNKVHSTSDPDNEQVVITLYDDQTAGYWTGGTYQNNGDGFIAPVVVQGDTSNWDGKPSGAIQITAGGQWTVGGNQARGVTFKYLYITGTDGKTVAQASEAPNSNLICDGCGFGAGYTPSSPGTVRCMNCVSIDSPDYAFSDYVSTSANYTGSYFNCTAINAGAYGFGKEYNGSVNSYNSVSFNGTSGDFGTISAGDYNACSDTSCNGFTNYVASLTMSNELVDGANGDVHLKSTSNLIDEGNDYSSTTGIDYDIDNVTRSGTWDIGADEYVASNRLMIIQ